MSNKLFFWHFLGLRIDKFTSLGFASMHSFQHLFLLLTLEMWPHPPVSVCWSLQPYQESKSYEGPYSNRLKPDQTTRHFTTLFWKSQGSDYFFRPYQTHFIVLICDQDQKSFQPKLFTYLYCEYFSGFFRLPTLYSSKIERF